MSATRPNPDQTMQWVAGLVILGVAAAVLVWVLVVGSHDPHALFPPTTTTCCTGRCS